ncbi:unnamed protein product, partial [marine sediment metagenome]
MKVKDYQFEDALRLYEQALVIYQQAGDSLGEAEALIDIGEMYQHKFDYVTALARYEES